MGFPKTTGAATGVTIALENAQKLQPMFARSYDRDLARPA
jgi:hypothetical protein